MLVVLLQDQVAMVDPTNSRSCSTQCMPCRSRQIPQILVRPSWTVKDLRKDQLLTSDPFLEKRFAIGRFIANVELRECS
jgi:hypothetical protein